jgi:hypothetical protein
MVSHYILRLFRKWSHLIGNCMKSFVNRSFNSVKINIFLHINIGYCLILFGHVMKHYCATPFLTIVTFSSSSICTKWYYSINGRIDHWIVFHTGIYHFASSFPVEYYISACFPVQKYDVLSISFWNDLEGVPS